jgi:hypothetical protein
LSARVRAWVALLLACGSLACAGGFGSLFGRNAPEPPPVSSRPPPLVEDLSTFDWSQHLEEWLPAIDACLTRTPAPPAVALLAWSPKPGLVGVRTRGVGPQRWDCLSRSDGAGIERFEPVAAPETHPAEASPLFSRGPHEPPAGSCFDHERALAQDGRFLGWLSYNVCS